MYLKIHWDILNFPGNSGELPFRVFFLIAGEATVELWGEKGAEQIWQDCESDTLIEL